MAIASPLPRRIPLTLKIAYTLFVAVLVPFYWYMYGPTNFLYFCDVAAFFTLAAVWWESPLLASMPAVGILLPQLVWVIDYLSILIGQPLLGMTAYMFQYNDNLEMFIRGLSLFHGWLPFLLLWLVYRLGYDTRAFAAWTVLAWMLLCIGYFLMPAPPPPSDNKNLPVNINYVYGLSDDKPQEWLPPLGWFAFMLVGLPMLIFWPTHWILKMLFARRGGEKPEPAASEVA